MMGAGTRGRATALATAFALLVFLLLPASLYLGNLPDFSAAPAPIARVLLIPALLLVVLVMLGLRASRRPDHALPCALLAASTLLAWVQSYLLVWNYGLLDGDSIDWAAEAWRGWVDLPLWIAGLAAATVFHRRLERPLATAAFAVVALQAVAVLGDGYARREALALKTTGHHASDIAAMGRFSPERNVLHIVLDSFQADVFRDLVTGPGGDAIQAALPGFTFYEEHVGTFPATYLAMPVIVSGQVYRNHVPQRDFMDDAYSRGSILRAARVAGFEVDVAAGAWLLDLLSKGGVDNAYLPGEPPLVQQAARLLDLALFRLSPHWVKPAVYNEQRWLTQRLLAPSDLAQFPYFTDSAFLAEITRSLTADRGKPVYKFFHIMSSHRPFVVAPDCSPAGRVLPRIRPVVTDQSRCTLAYVVGLLNAMKRAGIYDRSMIVLMADHGGHVPPLRYQPAAVGDGVLQPHEVAMATPLLAIKPPGHTAPFVTSPFLSSMTDVAATIDALMQFGGRMPGTSIWGDKRVQPQRRYYFYAWRSTDPDSEYIKWIGELVISGSVYQAESWQPVGILYPPADRD